MSEHDFPRECHPANCVFEAMQQTVAAQAERIKALESVNQQLNRKIDIMESCEASYIEQIHTLHERLEKAVYGEVGR